MPTPPDASCQIPEPLPLIRGFVNTNDLEEGVDQIRHETGLRAWFLEEGLISEDTSVTEIDLTQAHQVREAIRSLAMANNGWPADPRAIQALNRLLAEVPLRLRFSKSGEATLQFPTDTVRGAIAGIASRVYESMVAGTWPRFKACRRDICRWVFYDRSRNGSRRWCAMSICGNRVKTRAYHYRRMSRSGR